MQTKKKAKNSSLIKETSLREIKPGRCERSEEARGFVVKERLSSQSSARQSSVHCLRSKRDGEKDETRDDFLEDYEIGVCGGVTE